MKLLANVSLIIFSIWIILIFFVVTIIVKLIRRSERRAEEKLNFEKENREQLKNLNERLTKIENMLKEVD